MKKDTRTTDEILDSFPFIIEYLTKNPWAFYVDKVNIYYLNISKTIDGYCIFYELSGFEGSEDSLPNKWNDLMNEPESGYIKKHSLREAVIEMENWLKENKYL